MFRILAMILNHAERKEEIMNFFNRFKLYDCTENQTSQRLVKTQIKHFVISSSDFMFGVSASIGILTLF